MQNANDVQSAICQRILCPFSHLICVKSSSIGKLYRTIAELFVSTLFRIGETDELRSRTYHAEKPLPHFDVNPYSIKWGCWDSNPEPKDYESSALTVELQPQVCYLEEVSRRT